MGQSQRRGSYTTTSGGVNSTCSSPKRSATGGPGSTPGGSSLSAAVAAAKECTFSNPLLSLSLRTLLHLQQQKGTLPHELQSGRPFIRESLLERCISEIDDKSRLSSDKTVSKDSDFWVDLAGFLVTTATTTTATVSSSSSSSSTIIIETCLQPATPQWVKHRALDLISKVGFSGNHILILNYALSLEKEDKSDTVSPASTAVAGSIVRLLSQQEGERNIYSSLCDSNNKLPISVQISLLEHPGSVDVVVKSKKTPETLLMALGVVSSSSSNFRPAPAPDHRLSQARADFLRQLLTTTSTFTVSPEDAWRCAISAPPIAEARLLSAIAVSTTATESSIHSRIATRLCDQLLGEMEKPKQQEQINWKTVWNQATALGDAAKSFSFAKCGVLEEEYGVEDTLLYVIERGEKSGEKLGLKAAGLAAKALSQLKLAFLYSSCERMIL